ncbi:unnamed protein product, partial [Iphiclides podalirius]
MDNPLTPNKILKLLHYAEDKSFSAKKRLPLKEEETKRVDLQENAMNKSSMHFESSSGILDLERVEGFGESGVGLMSLSKSTAFNPGEMTGRSTGTEDIKSQTVNLGTAKVGDMFEEYGRHSFALESLTSNLDKQTLEVNDIMRHSIATNYSFNSKRDLTADEASFVVKQAPLPVQQSARVNITTENTLESNTNMSMGSYFKNRCPEFSNILGKTDSPNRSVRPSISEVSTSVPMKSSENETNNPYKMDQSLDCVPSLTADQFLKRAHPSPFQIPTEESGASIDNENTENSLSISKIADYLGKQSNVSITGMLQLNNQKKQMSKKQPLSELHMNVQNTGKIDDKMLVTKLKDVRKMETASSASTMSTVISLDKLNINQEKTEIPAVVITRHSMNKNESHDIENKSRTVRSKSPSSKSQSTMSTVQENFTSFKSNDSPLHNSKEQWAEIHSSVVNGFVGTSSGAAITITTLTDSWLTAKFQFNNLPNFGRELTIELPRQPLLLSPGKTEQFSLHIISNVEMNATLPFSVYLKDASIDGEIEQNGELQVNFKMPTIQALSCDGMNKIAFPPIHENSSLTKYFVILSDCPVDLQLDLSIVEGDSMFTIKSVQEIRKNDVSKALMERHDSTEADQPRAGKTKGKISNKQLCRLTSGNAIRVSIMFTAPKLFELDLTENAITFKGALMVHLIGIKAVLKTVDLIGVVASANLEIDLPSQTLQITNETKSIALRNTGSITGNWIIRVKEKMSYENNVPFQVSPHRVEIRPGCEKQINISYTGPQDVAHEAILLLEDINSGNTKTVDICGGTDKPKIFPIKTNYSTMSWVRVGRKELSLRNSTNKKIQIRCQIVGEGFSIDLPGVESRGPYCVSFGPNDCRPLPIVFAPSSTAPHTAALHLAYDKSCEFSRKVKLFGCASGECVRWSGLVTYGDTALLRAAARSPISVALYNKYSVPAFICARVHFNLQYRCCEGSSRLEGARRVVGPRSAHSVVLRVEWARVERRARSVAASALAALTVLAGPELTRRRILRIIRNKTTGELDTSLLPDHLKVLAQEFEGQNVVSDEVLQDFEETTSSLNELIESLQELTAQIDLPQDFADENTIIINDDTVLEHHTLCD